MKLCDDNRTYAMPNVRVKELFCISDDHKQASGLVGGAMDKLFGPRHQRKCTLIGRQTLGSKNPKTGNYSGNLGLLQRGEASALLKVEAPFVNEAWLKITNPLVNDDFRAIHELEETKNDQKVDLVNNFFNLKLNLFGGFLGICLLCLLFKFLIIFCKRIKKNTAECQTTPAQLIRKFVVVSFSSARHRIAALSLLALFFEQFLWFFNILVTLTIKTDTVIVDTSKIIVDLEDAFKTKRTLCLYEDDIEHKISVFSGEKNVLRRLFEQKGRVTGSSAPEKGGYCLIKPGPELASVDTLSTFTISRYSHIMILAIFFRDLKPKLSLYLSRPVYSLNLHLYHVFKEDEEEFLRTILFYTESGIYEQMNQMIIRGALSLMRKQDRMYTSLNDYEGESSHFENMSLENFRSIFIAFFLTCSLVLVAFASKMVYRQLARKWLPLWRHACSGLYRNLKRNLSNRLRRLARKSGRTAAETPVFT